jgi:hypothetical protein
MIKSSHEHGNNGCFWQEDRMGRGKAVTSGTAEILCPFLE